MAHRPDLVVQDDLKHRVRDFWEKAPCGEVYAVGESERAQMEAQSQARYTLEPYISDFACFAEGRDRDILEIGVGLGADHFEWAKAGPRTLTGLDFSRSAVDWTRRRFAAFGATSRLLVGDAENLPFPSAAFDLVWSYGVLHHTPETSHAVHEVHRVLRPGGIARVMIYHTHSLVGAMLWTRYALLGGRPWRSLSDVYAAHLESPGTKTYTPHEARALFRDFAHTDVRVQLSFGDLLEGGVGQRHRGAALRAAKALWPRGFIRRMLPGAGLFLFIEAVK